MARRLPKDLAWTEVVLEHEHPSCSACGRRMHVKKNRRRRVYTLKGPVCYVSKRRRFSHAQELTLAMPRWLIGWDVFCWLATLVGAAASCRVVGQLRDRAVRGRDRGLFAALSIACWQRVSKTSRC